MNIHIDPDRQSRGSLSGARAYRTKFCPRVSVLDQVIAGLLWLQLDLPDDVSRSEMEAFARLLIGKIRDGAGEAGLENEITILQCAHFGRRANAPLIRDLARRALLAVSGA